VGAEVSFTFRGDTLNFNASDANESLQREHVIASPTSRTGVPRAEVRALYADEFARLAQDATVRNYLSLRATSNVLAMLRGRRARA
jgi:hypothetical protein